MARSGGPDLTVECHEYQLYRQQDQMLVSFQRLFPVDDLENRRLRPIVAAGTAEVREQLVTNQRRAKSVTIIHQHQLAMLDRPAEPVRLPTCSLPAARLPPAQS